MTRATSVNSNVSILNRVSPSGLDGAEEKMGPSMFKTSLVVPLGRWGAGLHYIMLKLLREAQILEGGSQLRRGLIDA